MFHPDLSPSWVDLENIYVALDDPDSQCSHDFSSSTLHVGWFDPRHNYSKGTVLPGLYQCFAGSLPTSNRAHETYHNCGFCGANPTIKSQGKPMMLGCAEIKIVGKDAAYHAPVLRLHYVEEHEYSPAQEFIEAVLWAANKSS
jgi:hypothetical protein